MRLTNPTARLLTIAAVCLAAACSSEPVPSPSQSASDGPSVTAVVAKNLESPWSVVPLSDGSAFVSERDAARILLLTDGETRELKQFDDVVTEAEAGLMGLAITADEKTLFAMYTAGSGNKVVSMSWNGHDLGEATDVISGIPRAKFHDGGRVAVGPKDHLFVATGDAGTPASAQDKDSLAGKILRLREDGTVPDDNPFPDSATYSLGHRNVQGLAFDAQGRLWATEFGESEYDELNLIVPGGNYGWPIHEGPTDGDTEFLGPKASWTPTSEASPSGMAILAGSAWVAALRGERLSQVPLDGESAGTPVAWFEGDYGRLRDIAATGPNSFWMLTNNTDGRGTPAADEDRILEVRVG